jgi:aurora kinase
LDVVDLLQRKKAIQDFIIIKELGKGTFGRVVLAAEKESRMICAIKIMSKRDIRDKNMLDQLVREIKIQMFINHPNIIKIYGFFDDLLHFYII